MPYTEPELSRLLMEVRRPYLGEERRDWLMDRRRDVRHRRYKPWLPEGIEIEKASVLFRDSLPEYVINRIKQRLGVNELNIQVNVRGDAGPERQRRAERLEDWIRGVLDEMDPMGLVDSAVRENQAGDGEGWTQLEFKGGFMPPARNGEDDDDYDEMVDSARKGWGVPVCLNAVDPRSLYTPIGDKLTLVCKVVNRPFIDVRNKWANQGLALRLREDGKLDRYMLPAGDLPPSPTAAEYGRIARVVEIADCDYIYHCVYPQTAPSGPNQDAMFADAPGSTVGLVMMGRYPNPLGRPPFFNAPARSTSDPDPAYMRYPLASELLDTAEYVNQWMTMRMLKGVVEASMPVHYQPRIPQVASENAAPKVISKLLRPGFLQADGEFKAIPNTPLQDFDLVANTLSNLENGYNSGILGAMQSGQIGKSTPAWSLLQMAEEQSGLLKEALDQRAGMWREVFLAIIKLCREKYAKDGPVYVRARKRGRGREDENLDVIQGITSQDLSIPFRLTVSIDALSQSQRAALTEYGRRLWQEGTISQETYLENYVGVSDPVMEQRRKDREAMMVPMRKAAYGIGLQKGANALYAIHGDIILPILQAAGFPQPMAEGQGAAPTAAPTGGQPTPGGQGQSATGVVDNLKLPGQGLPIEQPQPNGKLPTAGGVA